MASSGPRISVDSFSTSSPGLPSAFRSEYPFPRPGSSVRPGSSGRYRPRRQSTTGSIHSVGGSLDTSSSGHVYESCQNAISTLLQAPIVRTGLLPLTSAPASSAHKPPTARDIPPVNLSSIPHVEPSQFTPYLTQVGALYDALQRAKDNEDEGGTQLLRKAKKGNDFSDLFEQERRPSNRNNLSRQGSLASLASSIDIPQPRRRSSKSRQANQTPTALSTIPNVYVEDDFHLENPRTFDVVSERSEVVRPVPGTPDEKKASNGSAIGPRKALATNAILQEKLSWYMDTVEIHLISSISTASSSFFAALGSLRDLHSEAADSVNRIKALRKELDTLDQEMAISGIDIVNKRRRRENLKQLSNAVQQLKRIVEALSHCESLVDSGEVDKALDAIIALEKLMSGEEPEKSNDGRIGLRNLRGAVTLQGVTTDLDNLRYRIGKIFETRFLNVLLEDLRHHVESVPTTETLQRWSSASQRSRGAHNREPSMQPAYFSVRPELRSELFSILNGLDRSGHIIPATAAYRDAVLREVRSIMRRYMPSSNDDDADSTMSMISASTVGGGRPKGQKSSILARNLRAQDPDDAEEMLMKTYIGVGETMRRLVTQVKVLLDVTSVLGDPTSGIKSPPRSPNIAAIGARENPAIKAGLAVQEEMHQMLDMNNLLGQAVDIAQDKIVRVLKVRSDQSIHLPIENFLRYFTLNLLFANECEAVSGRSGTSLKSVVNGHIKDFACELGERERQNLAAEMEADPWNAKDFSDADNEQLNRILNSSTQDVEAWSTGRKIWLPPPQPNTTTLPSFNGTHLAPPLTNGNNTGTSTPTKATTRPAIIDSQTFILPLSAILCLHGLTTFLHLSTFIPTLTLDLSTSLISFLTLFNSRCTQLILGAGATRSAGLKNIITKHLALAAQALNFVSAIIPYVRECIRRNAPANMSVSQVMGEFDRVRRLLGEHVGGIYEKFGEIMRGRGMQHVKRMKSVDWEASLASAGKDGKDVVNPYMETLVKETLTLHKVLSKHLPEGTVEAIMKPIFDSYRELWGKAYGEIGVGSLVGWQRMLRDAEFFNNRLGSLDGACDTGDYIVGVVKGREPAPPAPAPVVTEVSSSDEVPEPVDLSSKDAEEEEKGKENGNTAVEGEEKERSGGEDGHVVTTEGSGER